MPELIVCPQCGQAVPLAAPAGQCPACLLRLGLASTGRAGDTPVTNPPHSAATKEFAADPATQDALGIDHATVTADGAEARTTAPGGPVLAGRVLRFGNYELREELGRGGMGVVFRAVQAVAGREVAVKVLLGGAAGGALHGGRFAAEVSALAQLRHPNIVTVYEVGEVAGSAFFSMEYAPNGTLAARLRDGPLPLADAAILIGKLADAAEAAHQLGVLHRDIKPGNVLVAADGEPKLSDFGLAKWVNRDDALTASGAVMGTPSYMPPEQARGAKEVGPTADVYALGATLYECLTGRPPFRGADAYVIVQQVLAQEPDAPRSIRPDIPADLEAVCLKCLDKDPTKRYASARDLAADLARWHNGESTVARPLTRKQRLWRRVRRRWKPLAAALLLAMGGAGTAIGLASTETPEQHVDRALRSGEPVVLIGQSGPPRWSRVACGGGEWKTDQPELPFEITAPDDVVLELAPSTYCDHYLIRAEMQLRESIVNDSWAGVYFAHDHGPPAPEGAVERLILVHYRRDLTRLANGQALRGDYARVLDSVICPVDGSPEFRVPSTLAAHPYPAVDGEMREAWRYFEIEVAPNGVWVRWRDPDGSLKPVGVQHAKGGVQENLLPFLQNNLGALEDFLMLNKNTISQTALRRLDFRPQGALGLYVMNARAAFRNVVFEPIIPGSTP